MKLVHWPLMGGLLHLTQRARRGLGGAAAVLLYSGPLLRVCGFNLPVKGLIEKLDFVLTG